MYAKALGTTERRRDSPPTWHSLGPVVRCCAAGGGPESLSACDWPTRIRCRAGGRHVRRQSVYRAAVQANPEGERGHPVSRPFVTLSHLPCQTICLASAPAHGRQIRAPRSASGVARMPFVRCAPRSCASPLMPHPQRSCAAPLPHMRRSAILAQNRMMGVRNIPLMWERCCTSIYGWTGHFAAAAIRPPTTAAGSSRPRGGGLVRHSVRRKIGAANWLRGALLRSRGRDWPRSARDRQTWRSGTKAFVGAAAARCTPGGARRRLPKRRG